MNLLTLLLATAALLVLALVLVARFSPKDAEVQRFEVLLKIIAPIVAAFPVVVGLLEYANNQREETANASRTEYIRATQLLMENDRAKELGGIAAVAQLAATDSERTWLMTDSLSTFVRLRAKESRPGTPLEFAAREFAPILDPHCPAHAPAECRYNYSPGLRGHDALFRSNPPVQAAISALGSRNHELENLSLPPAQFRPLVKSGPPLPPGSETPRAQVIRYIDSFWWRQARRESNDQLVNELQVGRRTEFATIGVRPWLNLSYANLRGAEAESAWFEGGNLRQTDLSFSSLARANLAKSTLAGAWIVGANLFGADLRGADLQFADVRGSDLGHSNLSRAWLSGASFLRANFWQALLQGAYLVATNMRDLQTASGANLDDVVAYRADFSDAKIAGDFIFGVCMRNAFLREARFDRADLRGVNLAGSDMRDADFSGARLQGADLRNTQLAGAHLNNVNLSHADLRGVDLSQTLGQPGSLSLSVTDNGTKFPPRWPKILTSEVSKSSTNISRDCNLQRTPAMRLALESWDTATSSKRAAWVGRHPAPSAKRP
jgi:uncharacterized protein YjbI with pentapeptide repeats